VYRFFSRQIENNQAFLDEVESNHCKNVLRIKEGQSVEVIDGKGGLWEGICHYPGKKTTTIELSTKLEINQHLNLLTIILPPTKNPARLEWFVEKATELGVGRIIPVVTKRTEKVFLKSERLQKIVVSAGKQSKILHFPILEEAVNLDEYFKRFYHIDNQNFIAHCVEGMDKSPLILKNKALPCHVLIGPEGDFTPEEIEKARKHGFDYLTLGDNRLRVETAALHVVSIYNYLINI
jgi:16S rRNA (uracil1498-N3)-methyltransferase